MHGLPNAPKIMQLINNFASKVCNKVNDREILEDVLKMFA